MADLRVANGFSPRRERGVHWRRQESRTVRRRWWLQGMLRLERALTVTSQRKSLGLADQPGRHGAITSGNAAGAATASFVPGRKYRVPSLANSTCLMGYNPTVPQTRMVLHWCLRGHTAATLG